mgnify:FL=1
MVNPDSFLFTELDHPQLQMTPRQLSKNPNSRMLSSPSSRSNIGVKPNVEGDRGTFNKEIALLEREIALRTIAKLTEKRISELTESPKKKKGTVRRILSSFGRKSKPKSKEKQGGKKRRKTKRRKRKKRKKTKKR